MTSPGPIFHLALRETHAVAGASFAESGGWSLPMSYSGVVDEHHAIRSSTGVIDRSNRSRILVTGTDALDTLRAAFAGHLEDIEEGRAIRTAALDAEGMIRDLVLVSRTGGIAYMVSGEPTQRGQTLERLRSAVQPDFDANVEDRTESTCLIGVVGPGAAQIVAEHLADALPARLPSLGCVTFQFHGFRGLAIRTSDTGEDGFEFMLAPAVAQHLIETLTPVATLCGMQATEIARVEAAIPAYLPDLETGLSPAEADLDVLLDIPGGAEGRILAGILLETDPVAVGTPVSLEGRTIGEMRSCVRSPGLNATIGLGIIDAREAFPGKVLTMGGGTGTIVAKPFYRRRI
ncbi:MAG: glycine cleavage T C-terminal barrel domain-containing protein [bacterium]